MATDLRHFSYNLFQISLSSRNDLLCTVTFVFQNQNYPHTSSLQFFHSVVR